MNYETLISLTKLELELYERRNIYAELQKLNELKHNKSTVYNVIVKSEKGKVDRKILKTIKKPSNQTDLTDDDLLEIK